MGVAIDEEANQGGAGDRIITPGGQPDLNARNLLPGGYRDRGRNVQGTRGNLTKRRGNARSVGRKDARSGHSPRENYRQGPWMGSFDRNPLSCEKLCSTGRSRATLGSPLALMLKRSRSPKLMRQEITVIRGTQVDRWKLYPRQLMGC
ncbi:MAG: hypothetical protein EPN30_00200 [Actinomycetota bacterium]|nr:MAG: hypothetical protein EPN30_00200 [Actinomycetota bacterium]